MNESLGPGSRLISQSYRTRGYSKTWNTHTTCRSLRFSSHSNFVCGLSHHSFEILFLHFKCHHLLHGQTNRLVDFVLVSVRLFSFLLFLFFFQFGCRATSETHCTRRGRRPTTYYCHFQQELHCTRGSVKDHVVGRLDNLASAVDLDVKS